MTIKELYDDYVCRIQEVDKEIVRLQSKREAYNDIRLDLYNMIQVQERSERSEE